jgi:hypothetical protein
MIKKIVRTSLILLLLALAAVFGYLFFQRWQSFNIDIPKQADRVVRLNMEQISKKLIQAEGKGKAKEPILEQIDNALNLPFNVLGFGAKNITGNVYYIKLPIKNKDAFLKLVADYLPVAHINGVRYDKSELIGTIFNNAEAVFIIGRDTSTQIVNFAKDYLTQKNLIPFRESPLHEITDFSGDISSYGNMFQLDLSFRAGKLVGTVANNVKDDYEINFGVPQSAALAIISKENIATLLYRLGFRRLLPTLSSEQLHPYLDNGFALFIDGETRQRKEEVVYEFNEEFEKVAVSKISEQWVPKLIIKAPLKSEQSIAHLINKNVLRAPDSLNEKLLPLWKMHFVRKGEHTLFLYSGSNLDTIINSPVQLSGDADMIAWIDFKKLAQFELLQPFKKKLAVLDQFRLSHVADDQYRFELLFEDKNKSSLSQFLKLFK